MNSRSGWTALHAQLHRCLKHRQLVNQGQRLLIAVSGGQDSVCLARLLRDLQSRWQWHLGLAHCDHRWRSDSQGNASFVEQLATIWQLPYYQQTALEIPRSEATARHWRYQCLTEIAQQQEFSAVLTAHTASDRAETLLFNLVRGSGADGLQALSWQRCLAPGIRLIRPLLGVTRQQTRQFCQEQHLPVWEDITNQDLTYSRNRIRQELIPYLKTHLNPQADLNLAQTAELLQADVDYLEAQASQILASLSQPPRHLEATLSPSAQHQSGLQRRQLQQYHLALQRRVIRQLLRQFLPSHPKFEDVEKVLNLVSAPNRSQTDPLPGGTIAEALGDWIWFIAPKASDC